MNPRLALALALGCAAAGCIDTEPDADVLTVYAASSLTEAFRELAGAFEEARPGVGVALQFAGSQVLALQIEHGARADVFASADPAHLRALAELGKVSTRVAFAWNELALIVPTRNPARIETLADLPNARRLVIGTATVPVGAYARELLRLGSARFGTDFEALVLAHVVSEENNVRLIRAKVELGEADAALVYRTDALSSPRVRVIPVPPELTVSAEYSLGLVEPSVQRELASEWAGLVVSERGKRVLARHGFLVTDPGAHPATATPGPGRRHRPEAPESPAGL